MRRLQVLVFFTLTLIPVILIAQGSGNTLHLDGVDDYADMGDILNDVQFPFSVSAWIYWEGPLNGNNEEYAIITSDNHPGRNLIFFQTGVYQGFTLFIRADGSLNMRIGDGGNVGPDSRRDKWAPANVIPLNQWTHVAGVVRDLTDMDLYVNGVDVGGIYGGTGGDMDFSDNPFVIGRYTKDRFQDEEYFFDGKIDEVRVWDYNRTQEEIRQDMCHTLQGGENGLIAYWKFDEGVGNPLIGSSANAFGGNLQNTNATVWEISGAPLGDQSTYLYTGNWVGQNLQLAQPNGHAVLADQIQGTHPGMHLYQVNQAPNHINGMGGGETAHSYYAGTFIAQGNRNPVTSNYRLAYTYSPNEFEACDTVGTLYKRDDNADPVWVPLAAPHIPPSFTETPIEGRTEVAMGYVPCDSQMCNIAALGIMMNDTAICEGEAITTELVVTSTDNSDIFLASWEWDFGDGTTSTELTPSHTLPGAGTYTITLTILDINGCEAAATRAVEVFSNEEPEFFTSPDTSVCPGDTLSLEARPIGLPQSPIRFRWLPSGELGPGIHIEPVEDQVYTVEATYACGVVFRDINVEVSPAIEVDPTLIDITCAGAANGAASFQLTGGFEPFSSDWTGSGQESWTGNTWNLIELPVGSYEVTFQDALGCSIPQTFSISEPEFPLQLELVDQTPAYCGDSTGSIQLNASGGTGDYQFIWENGGNTPGPLAEKLPAGSYFIQVVDENGCMESLVVDIPSVAAPELSVSSIPTYTDVIEFETIAIFGIAFQAKSQDAQRITWNFGDSTFATGVNPSHLYAAPGTYPVEVRAFSPDSSCFTTLSFEVILEALERFFIPSAFSPNADGVNELFEVTGTGFETFTLDIFDRWGNKMIQLTEDNPSWDGYLPGGKIAPEGVYTYTLQVAYPEYTSRQAGTITLVR